MLAGMTATESTPDTAPIGVLIVDDEAFVRHALRAYLAAEVGITVLGEAADGEQAVTLARTLQPDVVLMDLQMPGVDGVEATRRIVEHTAAARVLVITGHVADTFISDSLLIGASGYVVKDAEPAQIVRAVRDVHAGDYPIDPAVTHHLIEELRRHGAPFPPRPEVTDLHVTEREKEVLEGLCEGKSNREIAQSMYIAETTVKYHLMSLMRKFDVRGRVELVVAALRRGIVH